MRPFLRALWPIAAEGYLTIWVNPGKLSLHAPLGDVLAAGDEDLAELFERNRTQDIYFSFGLRTPGLPSGKRGGKQDVVAIPGFVLDFDIKHQTAHKAQNLPTEEELGSILEGLPPPTVIVRSGHGWHAYWLFERPWVLDNASKRTQAQQAYAAFAARYAERMGARGWQFDNTASIERVWRLPGFVNHKSGAVVETLYLGDDRYTLDQLALPGAKRAAPASGRAATRATDATAAPASQGGASLAAPAEVIAALTRYATSNKPSSAEIADVLSGRSFAARGGRDAAMHKVCSTIAFVAGLDQDAADLAEILRPSLTVWANEPDATKTIDEEMDKAIEKIDRAQEAKYTREQEEAVETARLGDFAGGLFDSKAPPTLDVSGNPVPPPSVPPPPTPGSLPLPQLIIQVRTSYWVWDFTRGKYVGPKIEKEILTFVREAWSGSALPSGVKLTYIDAKGAEKNKLFPRVMQDYGTVADDVLGKFALTSSYYDVETKTFVEAIAPLRVTEPVFNEQIDHWLRLLAGDHYEKLLDWIAAAPQQDEQCCALYLDGVPGAGKGLLAAGLARLWREGGPTPLENILGNFNGEMFKCPFILLDEGLPKGRGNVSADIRKIIGTLTHSYTEKFVVNRSVNGAIRLMIAANNDNVLAFGEENMTANDLQAIVGRFLRIGAHPEAARWLEENNPESVMTKAWVNEDMIAKHCIWLCLNREIARGRRFLVEGVAVDDMHRKLVMQGETAGLVYEWLARFATNPGQLYKSYETRSSTHLLPLAMLGGGQILVNAQGLIDCWGIYMGIETDRPSTTKVGATLRKLSEGSRKLGPEKNRTTYHKIRPDLVRGWAEDNQIGDDAKIAANLKNKLPGEDDALAQQYALAEDGLRRQGQALA